VQTCTLPCRHYDDASTVQCCNCDTNGYISHLRCYARNSHITNYYFLETGNRQQWNHLRQQCSSESQNTDQDAPSSFCPGTEYVAQHASKTWLHALCQSGDYAVPISQRCLSSFTQSFTTVPFVTAMNSTAELRIQFSLLTHKVGINSHPVYCIAALQLHSV